MVEKTAKKFNLQDNEKFGIFVTKDKKSSYYFNNVSHHWVFTDFDSKIGLKFLILDWNI